MINYKDISDLELVHYLKDDDHKAYNEILRRYVTILISFAARRLEDKQAAEDIVQDVLAHIWQKRSDLVVTTGLDRLLFTAVKNRILNYYQKQQISQKHIDNFQIFLDSSNNNTDYLVRHNDLAKLIEREIAALPENMRVVFEMTRNLNMTRKEIAEALDMPEDSVRSNMYRALKILKRRLGDSYLFLWMI